MTFELNEKLCLCERPLYGEEDICPDCILDMEASFDIIHPADFAHAVESEIDADLPYPMVFRGEADEVRPYRPAILQVEDELPF